MSSIESSADQRDRIDEPALCVRVRAGALLIGTHRDQSRWSPVLRHPTCSATASRRGPVTGRRTAILAASSNRPRARPPWQENGRCSRKARGSSR